KAQRVYVRPVGTWAHIERVVPKWIRGCEEPIKVLYDCGMGREFGQDELDDESAAIAEHGTLGGNNIEKWHVVRGQNRWKSAEECGHHPIPGTHPVIVTTDREWGGWRVPGAEYDHDPHRIEQQAQLMSRAPILLALLRRLTECAEREPENLSGSISELAGLARRVIDQIS
ncbi:MAG: hypothetical protein VX871_04575, partial [Pseudomonadota bacterium]|nr:hypothetical protein [Pseudomonadota bacterium]